MKISDLRNQIAIVPQDCVLFNDTIKYNIAYGGVKDPAFKAKLENETNVIEEREIMKEII